MLLVTVQWLYSVCPNKKWLPRISSITILNKISDKTDKFLLTCSYLFWGSFFIGTQCSG